MVLINELLTDKEYLLADGAMGTQILSSGLPAGDAPERWNLENPEKITQIHQSYLDSGSDIILTNTFGGNRLRLQLHDLDQRVEEVNRSAVTNARRAIRQIERPILIAGSMGPTGELIQPLGSLTFEEAVDAFAEQSAALAEGGADILWLETLSDLTEVKAGITGIRKVTNLPIAVTMSYDTAGRTMMGVTATEAATTLTDLGVAAIGANCGANLPDTELAVSEIANTCKEIPVISKANAGIPVWKGAELVFDGTPEVLAAHALRVREAGASIIGCCCGSTSSHIELIAKVLSGSVPPPDINFIEPDNRTAKTKTTKPIRQRRRRNQ